MVADPDAWRLEAEGCSSTSASGDCYSCNRENGSDLTRKDNIRPLSTSTWGFLTNHTPGKGTMIEES
jgi:hypothetical protein